MRPFFTGLLLLLLYVQPLRAATEIPAFARKYGISCAVCHAPVPRLTPAGEQFAGNGFEFTPAEPPRDTVGTGDPLLRLQRSIPLAIRFDSYVTALSRRLRGEGAVDQQLPWVVKLLSGGQIARKISYYFYFLASERGEVAGLEDAYIQFTDVGGSGVNVVAGQFQVSDPLFKRELRLEYEDYQPYRMRIGETRADLAYDRGLMALWSPRNGTDLTVQLLNGEGLRQADAQRQYDSDGLKNVALRLSQDVGGFRVGAFAYFGHERAESGRSRVRIVGPDATLPIGAVAELNVQLLRRWDDDPFLGSCLPTDPCADGSTSARSSVVDAAMTELIVGPRGAQGRWYAAGLLNWIEADRPLVSLRLGEQDDAPGYLTRYRTGSLGLHYLLQRNVRLLSEGIWDFEREQAKLIGGVVLAF